MEEGQAIRSRGDACGETRMLLLPACALGVVVGVVGQTVSRPIWAAVFAVLTGASVSAFLALLFVVLFAVHGPSRWRARFDDDVVA